MRFVLTIDCDNDAFQNGEDMREVFEIMHEARAMLENGDRSGKVYDSNGNLAGLFGFEE